MTSDGELLRRYSEARSEDAFAELVRRHLNLVYSAALRQVNGDAHFAQDVAQTVFADLARKAGSLSQRPVLTGWPYTSTHFAAAKAVRTERRRQTHEQEGRLMHDLLHDSTPERDWEKLCPVLDSAMLELNEADREAVLLRYFENRPHADIATRLGLTENAARMRVERALDKLRNLISRRGVTTVAAISAVISANAVQAAPVGLAVTISAATIATGTAVATTITAASTATKAIAMTALQKTLVTVTVVVLAGVGIYEARQAAQLREQVLLLEQQREPLIVQLQQFTSDYSDIQRQLATLRDENERLNRNTGELLRLRAENAQLRAEIADAQNTAQGSTEAEPIEAAAKAWVAKAEILKKWVQEHPEQWIPEFEYLQDYDWLDAAKYSNMMGTNAPRHAMNGSLRESAKRQFAHEMGLALGRFVEAHEGHLPTELSQLNPYFQRPMKKDLINAYQLVHTGKLADLPEKETLVRELPSRSLVDDDGMRMLIRIGDYRRVWSPGTE